VYRLINPTLEEIEREEIERAINDFVYHLRPDISPDKMEPYHIKTERTSLLSIIGDYSSSQYEEGYSVGFEDGQDDCRWNMDSGLDDAYAEGYDEGYRVAREEE
jgi:hypothetical protein